MRILIITIFIILSFNAYGNTKDEQLQKNILEWKFVQGMSVNLHKRGVVHIFENRTLSETRTEYNLITFNITTVRGDTAQCRGVFKTFTIPDDSDIPDLTREFSSAFQINSRGMYAVPETAYQPSIRNIPGFPQTAVSPGSTWSASCEFLFYENDPVFLLITNAHYRYTENETISGKLCARIQFYYTFNENISAQLGLTAGDKLRSIYASNESVLWWDIKKGIPLRQTDSFFEVMIYNSGDRIDYVMHFTNTWDITFPLPDAELADISAGIKKTFDGHPAVQSSWNSNGVHITLGEVLFSHNTHTLTAEAAEILNRIGSVLAKYARYEIVIEGHTDSTGTDAYNVQLSCKRAQEVADSLSKNSGVLKDRIYTSGKGDRVPAGDNSTSEGRKKNRRVEIHLRQSGR